MPALRPPCGRVRGVSSDRVAAIEGGWSWCATAPGAVRDPLDAAAARPAWHPVARPGTAADALAALGPAQAARALPPGEAGWDDLDWWWRGPLPATPADAAGTRWLEADGLATWVTLWCVDPAGDAAERLLDARGMFTGHRVALPPPPAEGRDWQIWLCARSLSAAPVPPRPRPRWRTPMVPAPWMRWRRTTLLGRTPGWSPPGPPVGAWRPMRLRWRRLAVAAPTMRTWLRPAEGGRPETGRIELSIGLPADLRRACLVLHGGGRSWRAALQPGSADPRVPDAPGVSGVPGVSEDGTVPWRGALTCDAPARWWPHTHGEPVTHRVAVEATDAQGHVHEIDLGPTGWSGLRVDTAAGDFALSAHGVPVFCRGAVWTPLDRPGRPAGAAAVRQAVAAVRAAGMNMLRVAGTMLPADEALLDACDAEGVLLWHDLPYASLDLPTDDPDWRAEAEAEVAQRLADWQGRPSLAVVCGNSELSQQAAMAGAPREAWAPRWFHETLAAEVARALPDVAWWPSSAWGGAVPHAVGAGTCSYYGIGAYLRDPADARHAGVRFASECLAFAQPPDDATLARIGPAPRAHQPAWKQGSPRDLGAGWDFDDVRDHYVAQLFGIDPLQVRRTDHARYLRLSRIACAERLADAFVQWRRAGSGCRGALVLWLRDLAPGAGWGLLDDRGRPKSGWHALARVLQPEAVLLTDEGLDGLRIHLVHDGPRPLARTLVLSVWQREGLRDEASRPVRLPAHGVATLDASGLFDLFTDLTHAWRFGPRDHLAVQARLLDAEGRVTAEHWHLPEGVAAAAAHGQGDDPGLLATVEVIDADTAEVTLTARRLALHVMFETPGFLPADDGLHLPPMRPRRVRLLRDPDEPGGLAGAPGWVQALDGGHPVFIRPAMAGGGPR